MGIWNENEWGASHRIQNDETVFVVLMIITAAAEEAQ